jgi:hypothetical protein
VKDARQARRGEGTKEGKQDEEGTKEGKQDEEDDQLDAAALTEKYDRLAFGATCPRAGLSHPLISANTTAFSGAYKDTSTMEDGPPPPRPEQTRKQVSSRRAMS